MRLCLVWILLCCTACHTHKTIQQSPLVKAGLSYIPADHTELNLLDLNQSIYNPVSADSQSLVFTLEGLNHCSQDVISALWDLGEWKAPVTVFLTVEDVEKIQASKHFKALLKQLHKNGHQIALKTSVSRYEYWKSRIPKPTKHKHLFDDLSLNREYPQQESITAIQWNDFIHHEKTQLESLLQNLLPQHLQPISRLWRLPRSWMQKQRKALIQHLNSLPVGWHQHVTFPSTIQSLNQIKMMAEQFTIVPGSIVQLSQNALQIQGKQVCPVVTWLKHIKTRLKPLRLTLRTLEQSVPQLNVATAGIKLIALQSKAPSRSCRQVFQDSSLESDWVGYDRNQVSKNSSEVRWALVLKKLSNSQNSYDQKTKDSYLVLPMQSTVAKHPLPPTLKTSSELMMLWKKRNLWWQIPHCWQRVTTQDLHSPFNWITTHKKRPQWWQVFNQQKAVRVVKLPPSLPSIYHTQTLSLYHLLSQEKRFVFPLKLQAIVNEVLTQHRYQKAAHIQAQSAHLYLLSQELDWHTWKSHPNQKELAQQSIAAVMFMSSYPFMPYQVLATASGHREIHGLSYQKATHLSPMIYIPTQHKNHVLNFSYHQHHIPSYHWENIDDIVQWITIILSKHKYLKAGDIISQIKGDLPTVPKISVEQNLYDDQRAYLKSVIHAYITQWRTPLVDSKRFHFYSTIFGQQSIKFTPSIKMKSHTVP